MSRALWLRFLGISVFFALMLSVLYLVLVREVAGSSSNQVQRSIYLFLAHIVEEGPYAQSLQRIESFQAESPFMQTQLWVVSESGQVLAGDDAAQLPRIWRQLPKPLDIHEVVTKGRFFSGAPAAAVVRLNSAEPVYLVVRNAGQPGQHVYMWLVVFFIATMVGAMVIGLLLVTLYLRGRSHQARHVIAQIESGDLAARFDADRLDSVGGLMLDFNRMADEIQRLVARLQTTERARRDLLQELGHDLRTPLTSLKTAVETLVVHGNAMAPAERREFFNVITSEAEYFAKLIDDLFFIAEIDEPRYRKHSERIDLHALIAQEMRVAQGSKMAETRNITVT
jgi:methyl-accepting chemotaxis protein